jgi:hypothetical protein
MDSPESGAADKRARELSRRRALARLGLGAAVAYVAPSVVHLDRSNAQTVTPTPCPPPKKGTVNPGCPPG